MNNTLTNFIEWFQSRTDLIFAVVGILVLACFVVYMEFKQDASKHKDQKQWLEDYAFPVTYFDEIQKLYPHLKSEEISEAFDQLRQFFIHCLERSTKAMLLPRDLVDDCWKVMMLDSRQYQKFCHHVFGKYLHRGADGLADDLFTSSNELASNKQKRELM